MIISVYDTFSSAYVSFLAKTWLLTLETYGATVHFYLKIIPRILCHPNTILSAVVKG